MKIFYEEQATTGCVKTKITLWEDSDQKNRALTMLEWLQDETLFQWPHKSGDLKMSEETWRSHMLTIESDRTWETQVGKLPNI